MSTSPNATLAEALDKLWRQYLPQIQDRVATLEAAASALAHGELSNTGQDAANSAAHKLAGVLGTFGLDQGTVLAREAEEFYSGRSPITDEAKDRLAWIASQIRIMIVSRR